MEDLNLTETEMRYFGDLFLCCDEESNGKIPILKATELFRSSNIPNEVLKQIMDISVAPNNCSSLNHMNRKQFYSALKLIAAHQTNVALKPELLSTPLDLPLPRFTWALNSEANADLIQLSNSPKEQHILKRERNFVANLNAYEPIRLSSNLSDSDVPQALSHDATEGLSTDSEIESETTSQRSDSHGRRGQNGSPWSTASESPTPTNSVAERVHPAWQHSATGRGVWPASTEEHTRLLGTEEESSDRHSSEEDGETEPGDVWAISEAQARHYAAQFAQLRPEHGLLSGPTARLFFEKSRLSVPDLRKIWQLSDITKDGMLTLEEFSIAMHLIVLRRNNVPVPDALPACLVPRVDSRFSQRAVTTDLVDLGADMFGSGTSADFNFAPKPETNDPYEATPPRKPDEPSPRADQPAPREWTKFVDSPTSSLASPGPKPVNFDFKRATVERDPKIFHPVAVRGTPEAGSPVSPRREAGARRKEPPPPPPRPLRQHTRSSSLDLQRLKAAPPPPPRHASPPSPPRLQPPYDADGFPKMHGAFEVYRKPSRESSVEGAADARALREQNAVLHRVCRALQAELADVARERAALQLRLDGLQLAGDALPPP